MVQFYNFHGKLTNCENLKATYCTVHKDHTIGAASAKNRPMK